MAISARPLARRRSPWRAAPTQIGLGRPVVRREELPARAPRAPAEEQQRRLLRMCERDSARDRAIVVTLLYTGLRLAELVALDIDHVRVSRAKVSWSCAPARGTPTGRCRSTPSCARCSRNGSASAAPGRREGERALFAGRGGRRLWKRSVDDVVRRLGQDAGVTLSAHMLRHTFLTGMVRRGSDLVLVAEFAGHRHLETTRRYILPSDADRLLAVERLQIDY